MTIGSETASSHFDQPDWYRYEVVFLQKLAQASAREYFCFQ